MAGSVPGPGRGLSAPGPFQHSGGYGTAPSARRGRDVAAQGVQIEGQRVEREVRAVGDVGEVAARVIAADHADQRGAGPVADQEGTAGGAADIARAGDLQEVARGARVRAGVAV